MTAALGIELRSDPVERVETDVAVVPFFSDERPLQGDAGRADWRLCGRISELLVAGTLQGESGEALLVTAPGGIRCGRVIALGLGARGRFDADAVRETARDAVLRALGLRCRSLAMSLPAEDGDALPLGLQVEALVTGAAHAVAERECEIQFVLLTGPDQLPQIQEALRGVRPRGLPGPVALRLPSPTPPSRDVTERPADLL